MDGNLYALNRHLEEDAERGREWEAVEKELWLASLEESFTPETDGDGATCYGFATEWRGVIIHERHEHSL